MSKRKPQLCFTTRTAHAEGRFRELTITVCQMEWIDAMEKVRVNLGQPYCEQFVKEAEAIRAATGGTRSLSSQHMADDSTIGITWLESHDKPREWFAPKVTIEKATKPSLDMLGRIIRAAGYLDWTIAPRKWLARLVESTRAVPIRYLREIGAGTFVRDEQWTMDGAIPPKHSEAA